jgi:THO complex subunit 2
VQNKYEMLRRSDANFKSMSASERHEKYIQACEVVLGPIVESVRPLHAAKIWEDISPQFLVTFWSLTTYDLYVPSKSYQQEVSRLKALAAQAMDNKDGVSVNHSAIV